MQREALAQTADADAVIFGHTNLFSSDSEKEFWFRKAVLIPKSSQTNILQQDLIPSIPQPQLLFCYQDALGAAAFPSLMNE